MSNAAAASGLPGSCCIQRLETALLCGRSAAGGRAGGAAAATAAGPPAMAAGVGCDRCLPVDPGTLIWPTPAADNDNSATFEDHTPHYCTTTVRFVQGGQQGWSGCSCRNLLPLCCMCGMRSPSTDAFGGWLLHNAWALAVAHAMLRLCWRFVVHTLADWPALAAPAGYRSWGCHWVLFSQPSD